MKTGQTAPKLPLFHKTVSLHKTLDIHKTPNIRKILLPLDGRNGTYEVSKVREDKAYRPVLDAEEVTVSLSTNAKA
jgi:hypothetical protein